MQEQYLSDLYDTQNFIPAQKSSRYNTNDQQYLFEKMNQQLININNHSVPRYNESETVTNCINNSYMHPTLFPSYPSTPYMKYEVLPCDTGHDFLVKPIDDASPVKLFVNRIPKWMTNDELKKVFTPYGDVLECNILKDSIGSKGCAFIRYASMRDAQTAILSLHGKTILNMESGPIQIKYADGEVDRLGLTRDMQPGGEAVKLFVGCLPKICDESTLYTLFCRYGRVDEVHVLRDKNNQSKRSAFVTYPKMCMALEAIKHLDRKHILPESKRPLEVRLAESKAIGKRKKQQMSTSGLLTR